MGDVTITRGKGLQNDFLDVTNWTADSGVAGTTDGDILTLTGMTTVNGFGRTGLSLNTDIYPKLILRAKLTNILNVLARLRITFSDASTQDLDFGLFPSFFLYSFTLTAGKTVSSMKFLPSTSLPGGATQFAVDFVYIFKETLTLPAIIQPMPLSVRANMVELPILDRQGGVLQYLGSQSPEVIIQGALVTTTTPTNHTAAEWWNILEGLVMEGANETWQWLTSDRVNYKYLPTDLARSEILARKNYHEFTLRLKRFDVLDQTTDRLGYNY